ncbi:MAG: DUF1326 domain-containing protein [Bryobacteraceae bacterium]
MKKVLAFFAVSSLALAGGIPSTNVSGDYVEARTADVYTGPCFGNAEAGLTGNLAVLGWKVRKGAWQGVDLAGLSVVGVVRASATLGDVHASAYPVKSVLIVDERATPEQRLALKSFARRMSGDLLQDIVRVVYRPVDLNFANDNLHSMKATLTAGELAKIQTRAMKEGDHVCGNEEVWYDPLVKLSHAMPAVAVTHDYKGEGLGTTWSSPDKRSAFVGNFHFEEGPTVPVSD